MTWSATQRSTGARLSASSRGTTCSLVLLDASPTVSCWSCSPAIESSTSVRSVRLRWSVAGMVARLGRLPRPSTTRPSTIVIPGSWCFAQAPSFWHGWRSRTGTGRFCLGPGTLLRCWTPGSVTGTRLPRKRSQDGVATGHGGRPMVAGPGSRRWMRRRLRPTAPSNWKMGDCSMRAIHGPLPSRGFGRLTKTRPSKWVTRRQLQWSPPTKAVPGR